MGLFSRRIVSRMLRENLHFINADKVGNHVNHLNGTDIVRRLTTEWEVAVLNGLSKFGGVEFEPKLAGTVAVDLLFGFQNHQTLIEITTVSDRGLDEANPVSRLCEELVQRVRERGLDPDKFEVSVDGNWQDLRLGGPKPRLFLPHKDEFGDVVFNDRFQEFLKKISSSQGKASLRVPFKGDAGLTISYDPTQRFFTCSHLAYTVPFHVRNNPLYNRLHRKAVQLSKAQFNGMKGTVICDAGCSILNRWGQRGLDLDQSDIILAHLKDEPSVDFVLVLTVPSDMSSFLGPEHLKIVGRAYCKTNDREIIFFLHSLCKNLESNLPRPEKTPINALSLTSEGTSFLGGGTLAGNRIKISSRTVVSLLAGEIAPEEFKRYHRDFSAYFAGMVREGRMVSDVRIERTERDDDWIEFIFSDPDPAISPFDIKS